MTLAVLAAASAPSRPTPLQGEELRGTRDYNSVMAVHARAGDWPSVGKLFCKMQLMGCKPDIVTFNIFISARSRQGGMEEGLAASLLRRVDDAGLWPDAVTFNTLISSCGNNNRLDDAIFVFEQMYHRRIKPDVWTFNTMISVYARAGKAEAAKMVFQGMQAQGYAPDAVTFNTMLHAFAKVGKVEEVDTLRQLMINSSCEPDGITYSTMIHMYAKLGLHEELLKLLQEMKDADVRMDTGTFTVLIDSFGKAGLVKEAAAVFEDMRSSQTTTPSLQVFTAVICAYAKAGMHTKAIEAYDCLLSADIRPDVLAYSVMLDVYFRAGMLDKCILQYRSMIEEKMKPEVTVFCTVVRLYHSLEKQEEMPNLCEDVIASGLDLCLLVSALSEGGFYNEATTVKKVARSLEAKASSKCAQAAKTEGQQLSICEGTRGASPSQKSSSVLDCLLNLDELLQQGKIDDARQLYRETKESGCISRREEFKELLALFCRKGGLKEAEELVVDMTEAGFEADLDVYNQMIAMYIARGGYRQALQVFKGMQEVGCSPDAATYDSIVTLYARRGMVREVKELLERMTEDGWTPSLASYTAVISAYGRKQMHDEAEAVFRQMVATGCKPDAMVYNIMINIYRASGKRDRVEDILYRMSDEGLRPSFATVNMLLDCYAKSGSVKEVEDAIEQLPELRMSADVVHYTSLIDGQLKSKDYLSAVLSLKKMKASGVQPTLFTATCFVGAASLCEETSHAVMLLKSLAEAGFALPHRLLTESGEQVLQHMHDAFDQLEETGVEAARGFVNVIIDLLWAFRQCATAGLVLSAAIDKHVYDNIARVQHRAWAADFRCLSPGAALVALTLWLDQMQDAALEGFPEPPRIVSIYTGCKSQSTTASVQKTVKSRLYQIGSPFLPSRLREGVLEAKGHSLRLWLKESPYCMDLELRDRKTLPERSSIRVHKGAMVWDGIADAISEIEESMGEAVLPKKYCRLVHLTPQGRSAAIEADLRGRAEKLAKQLRRRNLKS